MQFSLLSTSSLLSTCSIPHAGCVPDPPIDHPRGHDGVPNTDPGGSTYNGIDTDGISLEVQSVIASLEQLELHIDAVERFGKQCANPGSFMGALLAIGTSHARMADGVEYGYVGAVRDVLKSDGCNCSRANFVGACLGAAYGYYDDSDPATAEESRRGRIV